MLSFKSNIIHQSSPGKEKHMGLPTFLGVKGVVELVFCTINLPILKGDRVVFPVLSLQFQSC